MAAENEPITSNLNSNNSQTNYRVHTGQGKQFFLKVREKSGNFEFYIKSGNFD